MSEIVIEAADLLEVLTKELGHGSPYSPQELASLPRIIFREDAPYRLLDYFTGIRRVAFPDWDGIRLGALNEAKQLTKVSVLRSAVTDISALSTCPQLERLEIERCPVSDISVLSQLTQLEELTLKECLVDDLTPLVELIEGGAPLRELTVEGIPASQASLDALRAALAQRDDLTATVLDDESAEAGRRLRALGLPFTVTRVRARDEKTLIRPVGRFPTELNKNIASVLAHEFDALLALDDPTAEQFWQRARAMHEAHVASQPPPPPSFAWRDHIEAGDVTVARGWVEASALGERARAVLSRFIEHFPAATFSRYDRAYLDEMARVTGHAPPAWLAKLVTTLFYPGGHWQVVDRDADEAVSLSFGPNNDQETLGEHGLFGIGETRSQHLLCVNLHDVSDRTVYRLYPGELSTYASVSAMPVGYGDYLDLFGRCTGLGEYVDGEFTVTQPRGKRT